MVRAWPLEIVNGKPLDPAFIYEEVVDIRHQVAPDLFADFREDALPSSSIPALALTEAAYRHDAATGEQVALRLSDLLFEEGVDIAEPSVLDGASPPTTASRPLRRHLPRARRPRRGRRTGCDRVAPLLHRRRRASSARRST